MRAVELETTTMIAYSPIWTVLLVPVGLLLGSVSVLVILAADVRARRRGRHPAASLGEAYRSVQAS